jgi:hypothetical protein
MFGNVARQRHGEVEAQGVNSTSDSSITGVSTGRKPKRSKVRRIVSSIRWKAIWSRGSSSRTPGGVRGLIK